MRRTLILLIAILLTSSRVFAGPIIVATGVPVDGIGSNTQVGIYNAGTGEVTFYIPLSAAYSGIYGVTDSPGGFKVGTASDSGSGVSNALTMYMMFSPVQDPAQSAELSVVFEDLDLINVNDPSGFFEEIQFFDDSGSAISPLIDINGQTPGVTSPNSARPAKLPLAVGPLGRPVCIRWTNEVEEDAD